MILKKQLSTLTVLVSVFLMGAGCASTPELSDHDLETIDEFTTVIVRSVNTGNQYEAELLQSGFRELLLYLAETESPDFLNEIGSVKTTGEFSSFIAGRFGKTPMEIGLDAFIYWDSRVKFDYEAGKDDLLELTSEHFLYRFYEGTAAYDDIDRIIYLCEKNVSELIAFIDQDRILTKRFQENFDYLENNRIILELPPNSKLWSGFNKTAHMRVGYDFTENGFVSDISIALPYYNSLSSSVLTHEITHMIDLLFKIDLSETERFRAPLSEDEEAEFSGWWESIFEDIFPHDTQFGEGFAEYTAYQYSIFHHNFLLKPEERLRQTRSRRPIRSDILKKPAIALNRSRRLLQYAELQSMVTYLIERYGKEKFVKFYFDPPLTEECFNRYYGLSYSQAEAEWKMYYDF